MLYQPFSYQIEELEIILASLCFFSLLAMLVQDALKRIMMVIQETGKKLIINIQYPCYICANEYPDENQVVDHIEEMHGYTLHSRVAGLHRPPSNFYRFENDSKKKWDIQHYGCPSCWFRYPKKFKAQLINHIKNVHVPTKVEGFDQKYRDVSLEEHVGYDGEKDELWQEATEVIDCVCDDQDDNESAFVAHIVPALVKKDDQEDEKISPVAITDGSGENNMDNNIVFSTSPSSSNNIVRNPSGGHSLITVHQGCSLNRDIVEQIVQKLEALTALFKKLLDSH